MKNAYAVENMITKTHLFFGKEIILWWQLLMKKHALISSSNPAYVEKLLEEHEWLRQDDHTSNIPISVKNEQTFNQCLETTTSPTDDTSRIKI